MGKVRHARFGVSLCSSRVDRCAPVTLTIDSRWHGVGDCHHRTVCSTVTVWVELTDGVTDGTRRLLVALVRRQAQTSKRPEQCAVNRLAPVTEVRDCPVFNDVAAVDAQTFFGVVLKADVLDGVLFLTQHRVERLRVLRNRQIAVLRFFCFASSLADLLLGGH
ncbi:hypothetical protein D3C71_1081560 [compost metagenome]